MYYIFAKKIVMQNLKKISTYFLRHFKLCGEVKIHEKKLEEKF